MAEYDGLPLDTPIVVQDTPDYQRIATRTARGGTVQIVPKANSPLANSQTIAVNIASALTRLRQIQSQATTFVGQADYITLNLTSLNDLLHKSQLIATAVGDLATDMLWLARQLSGQFDATT